MGYAEIIDPGAFYETGFSGLALKHAEWGMEYLMRSKRNIQCGIRKPIGENSQAIYGQRTQQKLSDSSNLRGALCQTNGDNSVKSS